MPPPALLRPPLWPASLPLTAGPKSPGRLLRLLHHRLPRQPTCPALIRLATDRGQILAVSLAIAAPEHSGGSRPVSPAWTTCCPPLRRGDSPPLRIRHALRAAAARSCWRPRCYSPPRLAKNHRPRFPPPAAPPRPRRQPGGSENERRKISYR